MIPRIPVWQGGRVLMDGLSKKEFFLDFEPDSMIDGSGNLVPIRHGLIQVFEICVYAEHECQLESKFRKAIADIKDKFSECLVWEDEKIMVWEDNESVKFVEMAPKDDLSGKRHTLDWQMFGLFRAIGKRIS
jgi:hypothetical protein